MTRTWLITLSTLCLVAACAKPTPYQPANGGYGYSEQQIEDKRYRVSFEGNASTPRAEVQNYLLYRAAELTVQNGFDYFIIVDRDLERSTRYRNEAYIDDFGCRYRDRYGYRRSIGPRYVSGNSYPIDEYSGTADILLAEGEKPADDANAYDALDVLQRLQPTIRQPEE
jgi:hypothetical protein